jgi:hypothetical protein
MPTLTKNDRYKILALNPVFRRDLIRWHELAQKPASPMELFSRNQQVREKANQDLREKRMIEERMRAVGLSSPPAPAMFADASKQEDSSPVRPHMRVVRVSTDRSTSKREDGKDVHDRRTVSKQEYNLTVNQILSIDIDISADTPQQLSKLVLKHITKARKQLGSERVRTSLLDDWKIWKKHRIKGKIKTQIARELTGIFTEDARKNDALNACIMSVQRSVKRIDEKIKALPYPPAIPRYVSTLR